MHRYNFVFTSLLVSSICLGLACSHNVPSECKQLCALSEEQQYQTFKNYPVEKQFELYVYCGNEKTCMRDSESPHDYFGQWMAQDNKAAPFLVERLKTERDESIQWDILYVLRFMAVNGHLRGRHDLAAVTNQIATNMKGGFIDRVFGDEWRIEQSKEWAREIEMNTR